MADSGISMPRNEEGEFELMLGNKEMLSVLFIVIVLLGVFFAMGYVVGRNSAPVETASKGEPSVRNDSSLRADRKQPAPPLGEPTSVQRAHQAEAPKPVEISPVSLGQPTPGQTYLQVSAVAKAEAEVLNDVLIKKGFRAMIAPGPTDKLFRVLVGPAEDATNLGKLKGDLEQAGFKSIVRKY